MSNAPDPGYPYSNPVPLWVNFEVKHQWMTFYPTQLPPLYPRKPVQKGPKKYEVCCAMLYSDRGPISAVGHPGDVWVSKGADKGVWVKTGGFAGGGQWEPWGGNETQFQHPTFPDYVLWFQHERWVWVHLNSLEGRRARWRRGKNLGGAWMMEKGRFVEESCRQRRVQRAVLGTALDAIEQWLESQQEKAQKRELSDDSELEATPPPKRSRVDDTVAASVGCVATSVSVLPPTSTSSEGLGEPPTPSSSTNLNDVTSTSAEFTSDPCPPSISPPEDHGRSEPPSPALSTSREHTVIRNPAECDDSLVANDRTSSPSEPQNLSPTILTTERASSTAKLSPSTRCQGAHTSTPVGAYVLQPGASENTGSLDAPTCGQPRAVHDGASRANRDDGGANQDCELIKRAANRIHHQHVAHIAILQHKLLTTQHELLTTQRLLLATKDTVSRLEADARARETAVDERQMNDAAMGDAQWEAGGSPADNGRGNCAAREDDDAAAHTDSRDCCIC